MNNLASGDLKCKVALSVMIVLSYLVTQWPFLRNTCLFYLQY